MNYTGLNHYFIRVIMYRTVALCNIMIPYHPGMQTYNHSSLILGACNCSSLEKQNTAVYSNACIFMKARKKMLENNKRSCKEYWRQIYFVISRSGAFCTAFMKSHTEKNILWTPKLYESTKLNSCKKPCEFTEGFSSRNSVRMVLATDRSADKYCLSYQVISNVILSTSEHQLRPCFQYRSFQKSQLLPKISVLGFRLSLPEAGEWCFSPFASMSKHGLSCSL